MEQLPSSIMGSNPGDKKFPWGQLPVKLLQASCSLVQWPDGEMFNYYRLFKVQSIKSIPDGVFKALWWHTMKLPPNQRPQVHTLRAKDDHEPIISSVSGATLVSVVQARHKMWTYAGVIRDEDAIDQTTPSIPSSSIPRKRSVMDPVSRPALKKRAVYHSSHPHQPKSHPIIESDDSEDDPPNPPSLSPPSPPPHHRPRAKPKKQSTRDPVSLPALNKQTARCSSCPCQPKSQPIIESSDDLDDDPPHQPPSSSS